MLTNRGPTVEQVTADRVGEVRLVPPRRSREPGGPLDPEQAEAVAHRQGSGPLVVVGGPGSGKTRVLVESVVARVERDGVSPDAVLVLAPTRSAAAALREQISARVARTVREVLARTPHSYAFGLLRRALVLDGDVPPRLISGPEQDHILGELLAGHERGAGRPVAWPDTLGAQVRALRGFREELRDLLMRAVERGLDGPALADLGRLHSRPEWAAAGAVLEEYLEVTSLATPGAFDPAAIVDAAAGLLCGEADLLTAERDRWAFVAVDDAQDLTTAGNRLVDLLCAGGRDVLLTGDPDVGTQSFRGGAPALLSGATQRLRRVDGRPGRLLALPRIHRQGPALRAATRRVAARIGSSGLVAHRAAGSAKAAGRREGQIAVHVLGGAPQEAAFVAGELRRHHLFGQVAWSRMAVVVRSMRSTEPLRRALAGVGIPLAAPAAEAPLRDEPAVIPLRQALRCCVDPAALTPDLAVSLLGGPIGGADSLALRRLRQALRVEEIAAGGGRGSELLLVEALRSPDALSAIDPAVAHPARRVATVLAAGREAASTADGGTAERVLWAIWRATGLAEPWRRSALAGGAPGARADRDLDAVVALFEAVARFVDRLPGAGAAEFLEQIEGQDVPSDTLAERAPDGEAVALVTAAAAVGQEWDVVVVAGVQEGQWPDLRLRTSLLGGQQLADLVDGRGGPGAGSVMAQRRAVLDDELRLFHVAVSRARRHLLVTAVRSEDLQPSPFIDLVDPDAEAGEELRPLSKVPRGLTLPALVAELRSVATDPAAEPERRAEAAHELARLAEAGVPGADPDDWYGLAPLSSIGPLRPDGGPVRVSPSKVEAFQRCPLRWLLDTAGATGGASPSQALGMLVHEIAHEVPDGDEPRMRALLAERFGRLGLGEGWPADAERRRAEHMISKLAEYVTRSRRDGRRLVGTEMPLEVRVGRAVVRGQVDRLEADGKGRLVVVDLKTGKTKPSADELPRHAQLGVYQAAVAEGAFAGLGPAEEAAAARPGGALLVQLGTPDKHLSVQPQAAPADDEDPGWARQLIETTAEGMAGEEFPATVNQMCRFCQVRRSCPATPEGRAVGR